MRASILHTILDIYVLQAERQNSPFLSVQLKLDKDLTLSPQPPLKLVLNQFETGTKVASSSAPAYSLTPPNFTTPTTPTLRKV